jgi:hypothetical protein
MEEFGREFKVVDKNIKKLFEDQSAFSSKLERAVADVQNDLSNAPNEQLIKSIMKTELASYNTIVSKSINELNGYIQGVSKTVATKADREEVM